MATKSILLAVTDAQSLVDVTEALGAAWEITSVASEEDALEQFEKRSFDVLLVDFNFGSPDASDFMNLALEKRPDTVRFLFAYEADVALVAAKVLGSPHVLPKPIESGSLKSRIEDGVKESNDEQSGSEPANTPSAAPAIPSIYSEVLKALESPGVTIEQVGEIIARDAALTSEVLSLTKSSYLGLPRNITNPMEAVESLGLETIKAVVMALRFLAEHSRLKPGYVLLDQIWQHSINVGQIARDLVLFETKDRALASQALVAGLLHDLGKVVLAANFDDLYGRVHSLARKQPVALWDIEKEMFGANHGEIGACLIGMWNMPSAIVDAAALHHEPPLGEDQQITPLAAVHIANVLERELWLGGEDMPVAPIINAPFLNQLGLLQRLPVWRAAFRNRKSVNLDPDLESAETNQSAWTVLSNTPRSGTANRLPGPVAVTGTTTSGQPRNGQGTSPVHAGRYRRSGIYAGVAGVLVLLALWLRPQPERNPTELVYARTPAPQQAPAVGFSTPSPETVARRGELPRVPESVTAPQVTPTVAVAQKSPALPAASETVAKAAASVSPPESAAVAVPRATVATVQPPSVAPQKKAPPVFRLNGIIYTSVNPSAIVNGQRVTLGDRVDGATVVGIGPTTVTLQINGQRRTCVLR